MITQEYAKNPEAEVNIKCFRCRREFPVSEMLKEEPLPPPRETVVEGLLVCPSCGARKHTYYMTEALRYKQTVLAELLATWTASHDPRDWSKYRIAQKQYQQTFDNTQKRYAAIVKKEASGGRPKK